MKAERPPKTSDEIKKDMAEVAILAVSVATSLAIKAAGNLTAYLVNGRNEITLDQHIQHIREAGSKLD